MMREIPRAFRRYVDCGVLREVDLLPPGECSKYDAILCPGWSFDHDPFWNGLRGNPCSTVDLWDSVKEGLSALRGAHRCDCSSCRSSHGGECIAYGRSHREA